MSIEIASISENFCVAGQITPADLRFIADQGFRSVINNRPDGEGGAAQPTSNEIELEAKALGLSYVYLPVVNGQLTQSQVLETARLVEELPKPILAFCRSGARSTNVYLLSQQDS